MTEPIIQLDGVSFHYPGGDGVDDIDLRVNPGEVVVLCGSSGCGKTTITRLVNGLAPAFHPGELSGRLRVCGIDPSVSQPHELAGLVGSVFQNPRAQFFTTDTTSELVFGAENLAMPEPEIRSRLAATVQELALKPLLDRSIFELSGGEKQKIACASAALPGAKILVLDEPASNLDNDGALRLGEQIGHWRAAGRTVLIAEHRLDYLAAVTDRFIYLDNGRIVHEFSQDQMFAMSDDQLAGLSLRRVRAAGDVVEENAQRSSRNQRSRTDQSVSVHNLSCVVHKREVLNISDCRFASGQVTAITGRNGAGKSTLARSLVGLQRRAKGQIRFGERQLGNRGRLKRSFLVGQNVNHQLIADSVREEVELAAPPGTPEADIEAVIAEMGLADLAQRHPMTLSGGQRQRLAICCALASDRNLVVLDEPTSGLDYGHMAAVAQALRRLAAAGRSVVLVTHDDELVARAADRVIRLSAGRIETESVVTPRG